MAYFRKKPVVIEAVQWKGENTQEIKAFCPSAVGPVENRLTIPTLEGDHVAIPSDWIIKGVNGEFYPCKYEIFLKTYDAVDGQESQRK